ncbi:MAG: bifunctional metallophosphatase/5'-nucleotidase, partial [Firmicutes bacterium]|nr:bifunctional metallophosphatase/5'-nucleotidase [Bacillota bacterium]
MTFWHRILGGSRPAAGARTGSRGAGVLRRSAILFLVLVTVLSLSLSVFAEQKLLTVLDTSDFHGNLLPTKDYSLGRMLGGAGVLATYIRSYEVRNPQGTLLVDDGDLMQGPPISTLFHGQSTIDFYNYMGYDAAAVGNHEFDWGRAVLEERAKQADFPFLAANIVDTATGQPPSFAKPYVIKGINGVKVGLIGVTTLETPTIVLPDAVKGLEFIDPAQAVNSLVPKVRAEGAQVVVVLAHMGGQQAADGTITGEIADLAKQVKGVDLILGGHTHTLVSGQVNGIPVIVPGLWGQALGVATVVYDTDAQKVISVRTNLVRTFSDEVVPDAGALALVNAYQAKTGPLMDKVIGQTTTGIMRDYDHESAMGDFFADAMLAEIRKINPAVQIMFTNAGGLRTDVGPGPITVGKIWEICPFDNTIVTMKLTGEQILSILANKTKGMIQQSGLRFT